MSKYKQRISTIKQQRKAQQQTNTTIINNNQSTQHLKPNKNTQNIHICMHRVLISQRRETQQPPKTKTTKNATHSTKT